ncbi:aegerolysin family protein [Celerinatantimonas yamalensis]|uniref:Aegerolysin family protein n=1 Tax=Celerinatantimonas yamalensis TaxID=559956 RepID=A0ABW9G6G3_9GAMM
MASRSTVVKFQNETDLTLTRSNAELPHGVWSSNMYPPETVEANSTVTWESESDGFMTGTEGTASYNESNITITINWDNPFVGDNSYSCSSSDNTYTIHQESGTGGGDNATVTFTLTNGGN